MRDDKKKKKPTEMKKIKRKEFVEKNKWHDRKHIDYSMPTFWRNTIIKYDKLSNNNSLLIVRGRFFRAGALFLDISRLGICGLRPYIWVPKHILCVIICLNLIQWHSYFSQPTDSNYVGIIMLFFFWNSCYV